VEHDEEIMQSADVSDIGPEAGTRTVAGSLQERWKIRIDRI
jgi:excinuclease UvrABC ATPase subunit